MTRPTPLTVFTAPSAHARLDAVLSALGDLRQHRTITIIAPTRGAADDCARRLAAVHGATFGVFRFGLLQFAVKTALPALARQDLTPTSGLVTEAVSARATFDAIQSGALSYFAPVATMPGFPIALAQTFGELRLAGLRSAAVDEVPVIGHDLGGLLHQFEHALAGAGAIDRAGLFRMATERLRTRPSTDSYVLLDLPIADVAERDLVHAVIGGAGRVFATLCPGDQDCEALFRELGARFESGSDEPETDLSRLRRFLFVTDAQPSPRALDGSFALFSAPGEGRECIEIARRILRAAADGIRFDEMAVLLRAPLAYTGLLEHAFARAGVPAWFDRGTRRSHPAGRAFLALLACAAEGISAARFAEYLSLAQVPGSEDRAAEWETPRDDLAWRDSDREDDELETEVAEVAADAAKSHADAAVVAGTLRAPWRWESLIIDARIIGGGTARWKRRFDGHRRELERRRDSSARDNGSDVAGSPAALHAQASLRQLDHLERFALPIVEVLEGWTDDARWGTWLDRFETFVLSVLRRPAYVLRVLRELRPMASIGPVPLDEVRRVLAERLLTVEAEAPSRRQGRVFVGTPPQVRGRSFRLVFVPGLAERVFPQKSREDPLLLDHLREKLDPALRTESRRIAGERQLLRLAIGAASESVCASYPRLDLSEARARVPSFYTLDLLRAATGVVPAHQAVEAHARQMGSASLVWPAPQASSDALDEFEHDLAVVRRLLDARNTGDVRGHAHYLLNVSETLRRSVTQRWRRARPEWSPADGLVRVTPLTREALESQRLTRRSYSLSALQRFAACPYQFTLAAIFHLHPLEEPSPLERIDPLTRGSLVHEIQAKTMRAIQREGQLPLTAVTLPVAHEHLEKVIDVVERQAHDELAPAVERVWIDDIAAIRRDLRGWLMQMAADTDWLPAHFECAFGPVPGERDPASVADPVVLDGGFSLRGAIDLIEVHKVTGKLRVTDYKTGRLPDELARITVGGGGVLQPVLYAMAAERMLETPAAEGRLFFCTWAAGYASHAIPLDDRTRRAGMEVLEIIDREIARGHLMAAPQQDTCARCDFVAVCGSRVAQRVEGKARAPLADLEALRDLR